jgi:hypothetical protein
VTLVVASARRRRRRRRRRRGRSSSSCNAEKGALLAVRLPPHLGLLRPSSWLFSGGNDAVPDV